MATATVQDASVSSHAEAAASARASHADVERETHDVERGAAEGKKDGAARNPPSAPAAAPAPMRNLYTAAMSYNGYTITDGALRLIVLLHAADLGFNAIEIAFMFSMYEVS